MTKAQEIFNSAVVEADHDHLKAALALNARMAVVPELRDNDHHEALGALIREALVTRIVR